MEGCGLFVRGVTVASLSGGVAEWGSDLDSDSLVELLCHCHKEDRVVSVTPRVPATLLCYTPDGSEETPL